MNFSVDMGSLVTVTRRIFAADGLLSAGLPDYEFRPGQLEMAVAVARSLPGGLLAAEAETGIGKTLAYLVPAVLSGQKVVVSTNTLNLQEQIHKREIPFIRKHIHPELSALCIKGRQNYLCLHRWHQYQAGSRESLFPEPDTVEQLRLWLATTATGDRAEIPGLPDNSPLWRELSARPDKCLGADCPEETACFINRLRKKAAACQILIVNHHLFFSDLALRATGYGEVLPRYESVIFDEAHHLESVATQYFGISFSHYQLLDLVQDIRRTCRQQGDGEESTCWRAAESLAVKAERFAAIFPPDRGRFPLSDFISREPGWNTARQEMTSGLESLADRLAGRAANGDGWSGLENRCRELREKLERICGGPAREEQAADDYVRWYEKRERTVTLSATPVEVATPLSVSLYHRVRSCVFASATLTADGKFDYFRERLGLPPETDTLRLPSPFDYENRTRLYIPDHRCRPGFPEPGRPDFAGILQREVVAVLENTGGRGLVLFTSIRTMQTCHPYLAASLPYAVLMQGEAPRHELLERFRRETDSVLLAVASFWEGVDVPGESLSCVIVDKLPFEVPSDPVIMARINWIREEGGNPFFDFQIPRAILSLRQGIGRLMRATSDRGILAIMDVRLYTKGYGQLFLKSLPPSPIIRSLDDIRTFFAEPAEPPAAPHRDEGKKHEGQATVAGESHPRD